MMNDYFNTPERRAAVRLAAQRWEGTPFALGASALHFGVDCAHLVAEVLVDCGHLASGYEFPGYGLDGGAHLTRSQVKTWLAADRRFRAVDLTLEALVPGDVLVFLIEEKGVEHHVGIFTETAGAYLYSAMGQDGAQKRTLRDRTWGDRLKAAWRPVEGSQ
jgi:cell wall-associated NlpC family hydrolase